MDIELIVDKLNEFRKTSLKEPQGIIVHDDFIVEYITYTRFDVNYDVSIRQTKQSLITLFGVRLFLTGNVKPDEIVIF
jgi:hypothetical protein